MKRSTEKETDMIISGACEIATMIHDYIAERPQLYSAGFTALGYANQILILNAAAESGIDYDDMSENFRDFLSQAQEDIKSIMEIPLPQDINVN